YDPDRRLEGIHKKSRTGSEGANLSEPLRIGIAGLGVASTQILPALSALSYVKITAAADTRPEAREKFAAVYHGETYTSVQAMCEQADIDAVYVATPNPLHAEHAITAACSGNILLSKSPWRCPW
ncbi:MAG: Gfo/Idh/MocA family protein, partial [Candidatus Binatia bacterium]